MAAISLRKKSRRTTRPNVTSFGSEIDDTDFSTSTSTSTSSSSDSELADEDDDDDEGDTEPDELAVRGRLWRCDDDGDVDKEEASEFEEVEDMSTSSPS
jgi:hypothetical protein